MYDRHSIVAPRCEQAVTLVKPAISPQNFRPPFALALLRALLTTTVDHDWKSGSVSESRSISTRRRADARLVVMEPKIMISSW